MQPNLSVRRRYWESGRDPTADLREPCSLQGVIKALIDPARSSSWYAMNDFDGTLRSGGPLVLRLHLRPADSQRNGTEIDLEAAEWRIPAEKMKMRRRHIVPLARQVVRLLLRAD